MIYLWIFNLLLTVPLLYISTLTPCSSLRLDPQSYFGLSLPYWIFVVTQAQTLKVSLLCILVVFNNMSNIFLIFVATAPCTASSKYLFKKEWTD